MFGPESYEKRSGDVYGFRIVVAAHTLPKNIYATCKKEIAKLGFNIIEKSAEAHDKESAQTLFLTHFIGQTVSRAGFVRTDIDTVSFGYLMDAVESVKHDAALFADVFKYNPYCKAILDKFEAGERKARKLLEQ
jgi:prephenate dehydrogenase